MTNSEANEGRFRTLYFWGSHCVRVWTDSAEDAILRAIDLDCSGVMVTYTAAESEGGRGYRCYLLNGNIEGTSQENFYAVQGVS